MTGRLEPLADPIHLVVDGKRTPAREGEPVAVALCAAGRLTLGRSVKYHRPRGAVCYSGRCDGCLMRVDGMPSVMTCRTPAKDGMVIETQNVIGSAERDLLAATDFFFPNRMNHHEMFTWNEQVNRVMQKVARRVAGIGTLPERVVPPQPSEVRDVDVLIVGAGPAGLAAAVVCGKSALRTAIVDEEDRAGGSLLHWPTAIAFEGKTSSGPEIARSLEARARESKVEILLRASAIAAFAPSEDVAGFSADADRTGSLVIAVDTEKELVRYRPRRLIIASGRNESSPGFQGSDRPGVLNLRGACTLLARGVMPGRRIVIAGEGEAVRALAAALKDKGADVIGPVREEDLDRARGRSSVTSCDVREKGAMVRHECDALIVATPSSAVFELAAQAGVPVEWRGAGYELAVDEHGYSAARGVHVIGAAAREEDLETALARAERAGVGVASDLGAR
jgi:sarcosine oxidase, subunit alpha